MDFNYSLNQERYERLDELGAVGWLDWTLIKMFPNMSGIQHIEILQLDRISFHWSRAFFSIMHGSTTFHSVHLLPVLLIPNNFINSNQSRRLNENQCHRFKVCSSMSTTYFRSFESFLVNQNQSKQTLLVQWFAVGQCIEIWETFCMNSVYWSNQSLWQYII